jgi:hypothetical protein
MEFWFDIDWDWDCDIQVNASSGMLWMGLDWTGLDWIPMDWRQQFGFVLSRWLFQEHGCAIFICLDGFSKNMDARCGNCLLAALATLFVSKPFQVT